MKNELDLYFDYALGCDVHHEYARQLGHRLDYPVLSLEYFFLLRLLDLFGSRLCVRIGLRLLGLILQVLDRLGVGIDLLSYHLGIASLVWVIDEPRGLIVADAIACVVLDHLAVDLLLGSGVDGVGGL